MAEIGTDIEKARYFLEKGELVAIPTETVYGLAANALDDLAVAKIFEAKNRPTFDPLIMHVSKLEEVEKYCINIDSSLYHLAKTFWPGPLTILVEKKNTVSDLVTSGLPRVAIRVPNNALTLSLLNTLDFPLAAPSANPFGYISPTTAEHVDAQLGKKVKYILDGGPCTVGLESTICGIENKIPIIYRLGGLPLEIIEEKSEMKWTLQNHSSSNPAAPGTLESHYAPTTQLIQGDIQALVTLIQPKKFGLISFKKDYAYNETHCLQIQLSPKGNMNEASAHLFSAMRALDDKDLEVIFAEVFPEEGLGRAINDRLKRASA
jgi:L-threonylcarbamoyladenylate synthase